MEIEIHKFFREAEKIFSDISDGWSQFSHLRDLYFSVALAEEIVRRRGYASQKKADIERIPSTALYLQWYRMVKRGGELTEEAKEVRALVEPAMESIRQRAKEFEETAFGELISHFENKLSDKWNEFDNNCIAYLKGSNFSDGFAAYFGSIKPTLDNQVGGKKRRESVKGFDGVEVGKCVDLGRFLVVKTAWRENQFGCSLSFTCISENGGKLWFQVTENSKTERLWNKLMGDKALSLFDIEVELRGTLTDVKQDISFAKRVSIKKIFENGKGVEG